MPITETGHWITIVERNPLDVVSITSVKTGELNVVLYNDDGEINECAASARMLSPA